MKNKLFLICSDSQIEAFIREQYGQNVFFLPLLALSSYTPQALQNIVDYKRLNSLIASCFGFTLAVILLTIADHVAFFLDPVSDSPYNGLTHWPCAGMGRGKSFG